MRSWGWPPWAIRRSSAGRLAALKASGLDRVSLVIGGGDLSVAETTRCVELLAEQVLPALADAPDVPARRVSA